MRVCKIGSGGLAVASFAIPSIASCVDTKCCFE